MNSNFIEKINDLNEPQKEALYHKDGPSIIIAGAGSGKTRVLTYRIAYLLSLGVDSFSILSLTFTNKAAREMKERISSLIGGNESKNLWMGTFHSVFARILRIEADKLGYSRNFTIYDSQDSEKLIRSIIKEMNLNKDFYKSKQIRNRISTLKNNLITVNSYYSDFELQEYDKIAQRPKTGDIYKEYVKRCFKSNSMDFDDLLLKTNELLNKFPDILSKYQNQFRYILVDEYQDTNHSQYKIVKLLSDKFQNISVVGDDSQSIYAFRGANINNILNFQQDYESVKVYKLEQNYRSTKNIVNAANSLIEHNKNKLNKEIWTNNSEGEKIFLKKLPTDSDEGRFVASSIFEYKEKKFFKNSDFAILYRTNAQSRSIEDSLRNMNIQYEVYGGISFYQRKEIKDFLAYLRVIINPNDEESLKRIINYPLRGIGQTSIDKLLIFSNKNDISIFQAMENIKKLDLGINSSTIKKIDDFVTLINGLIVSNLKIDAFEIAKEVALKTKLIYNLKKEGSIESISKAENVEELLNGIKDFIEGQKDVYEANDSLVDYLEDIALATDFDKSKDINDEKVSLMTIHLAKGLEFPVVFIVGLEEDLFPNSMNIDTREGLEEERRLFYVALTRAENQAIISYSESRYRWGKINYCEPSRFISEINESYIKNLSTNDKNYRISNKSNYIKNIDSQLNYKKLKSIKIKQINSFNYKEKPVKNPIIKIQIGDFVEHQRFGKGLVLELDGSGADKKAKIKFKGIGEKNLLLNFAKLKKIPPFGKEELL